MKRIYAFVATGVLLVVLPSLAAQTSQTPPPAESGPNYLNHAEIGIYADYFHFAPSGSSTNFVGVGGRAAFNMNPFVALEGEMNYDFARNFTTSYTTGSGAGATTSLPGPASARSQGSSDPNSNSAAAAPFASSQQEKSGSSTSAPTTPEWFQVSTFTGAVSGVGNAGTHLAFYPGGGFEGFFGPVGLRAEAGDEIYLNNGTYNNLRVTVGPAFRF